MTEQSPEPSHQDPAEPYETGTETETQPQPDDEVTTGGELNHTEEPAPVNPDENGEDDGADEPVEAQAVEVSPAAAPVSAQAAAASNMKTDNVHGKDYEVTPEAGYRRV